MVQVKISKPAAIVFDFSGTARDTFVEKTLMPHYKATYKSYLDENWSQDECKDDVKGLIASSKADKGAPQVDASDSKPQQIDSLCKYIEYCEDNKKFSEAYSMFRFHVWFKGYEKNRLSTPVYSDVAVYTQKWNLDLKIKLYVLSNGWSEATKKFMSKTSHGDLNLMIEDHFDTSLGSLTDAATYKKLTDKIKQKPMDIVFLTKSPLKAKAAKEAGLNVVMVITHGEAVDAASEICKDIPIARSFTQIEFF